MSDPDATLDALPPIPMNRGGSPAHRNRPTDRRRIAPPLAEARLFKRRARIWGTFRMVWVIVSPDQVLVWHPERKVWTLDHGLGQSAIVQLTRAARQGFGRLVLPSVMPVPEQVSEAWTATVTAVGGEAAATSEGGAR